MRKFLSNSFIVFIFLLITTLSFFTFFSFKTIEKTYPVYAKYLTRLDINEVIKKNKNFYIKMYGDYFNRKDVATSIINASLDFNIPVNLCFALGLAESNLNDKTKPNYNKNGTFDYGIFRLNNKTYPDVKTLSKLDNNVQQGILHLQDEYKKYSSYDVAIMTYNSGSINNIGKISIQHLNRVLGYEKALDEWFNNQYWSSFNRGFN